MANLNRLRIGVKALSQLGFPQVWNYAKYQIGLRSGFYRLRTPTASISGFLPDYVFAPNWFYQPPDLGAFSAFGDDYMEEILSRGEEVIHGDYRPFGRQPQPLDLELHFPIAHWVFHETGKARIPVEDIKLVWEPARFSWAIELGKAYYFSRDEKFARKFEVLYQDFRSINPLNIGPNWQSGQEVALRLIALIVTANLMHSSEIFDHQFLTQLCKDIADHAERIIPTLPYAQAQKNNHLLSEAVGLYTAALFLKDHPRSTKWKSVGRDLFGKAIIEQIDEDGEYTQHSTNYHRMMLTLALWMEALLASERKELEPDELEKLGKASTWLIGQYDEISGNAANLGHNDGSFILPFTTSEYADYRPVIQATSTSFLDTRILSDGAWNDLMIWMGIETSADAVSKPDLSIHWPSTRIGSLDSWANLRARQYHNRPAHADQLHIDLWFKGNNVLLDAGTYLYNTQPPWRNALVSAINHNTVSVDGLDPMQKAGRFLWLDWSQAKVLETSDDLVRAEQYGYQRLGIIHQRELKLISDTQWEVDDLLLPNGNKTSEHDFFIHWLLSDWLYQVSKEEIQFQTPFGRLTLETCPKSDENSIQLHLIRSGETLVGEYVSPNLGWYSPTYNEKVPAISVLYQVRALAPTTFKSRISIMAK
jgi:hypothetical protein